LNERQAKTVNYQECIAIKSHFRWTFIGQLRQRRIVTSKIWLKSCNALPAQAGMIILGNNEGDNIMKKPPLSFIVTVTFLAVSLGGAGAQHVLKHNAKVACRELVTVKHSELKGAARKSEINKCNADAEAYNR